MELKRFLGQVEQSTFILKEREFHHCVNVTRHKLGFLFIGINGDGNDYKCEITDITRDSVIASIIDIQKNLTEPTGRISLCLSLCKEFDFIVQKAVELGATDIFPFISSRSSSRSINKQRAENIIIDAVKQTGRSVVPSIHDVLDYESMLQLFPDCKNRLFCFENSSDRLISSYINLLEPDVVFVIGSEGGFDKQEVLEAKKRKWQTVSLGKRILRVETASIAALVLIMNKYGELSNGW